MRFRSFQVLFVLLFVCAHVMAATVTMTDNGDGTVTVAVTADGAVNIVALALDIDVTDGGNVTDVSIDTPCFNIFPDSAFSQELWVPGSYVYGSGTPIADTSAPGEIALAASFTLCAGCLNGAATPGADGAASVQFTLMLDAPATVCVSENALRGGIVSTDGTGEDITNGTEGLVCAPAGPCPCECLSSSAPFYADWVAFGSPDCWCYRKQCNGDADGLFQGNLKTGLLAVYTNDLTILANAYNIPEPPHGAGVSYPGICADFDHTAQGNTKTGLLRVYTNDLTILSNNYNVADPGVADCDMTNYYIWLN
ncbi:MAG: hypothetical protein ACYSPI_12855 [Planctomycetota bacterium]|jgi:hypothetical protein